MEKSEEESSVDKNGNDDIPLIIKPRLGSSPGKVRTSSNNLVLLVRIGLHLKRGLPLSHQCHMLSKSGPYLNFGRIGKSIPPH